MEPIIYVPYLKKTMQLVMQMNFIAVAFWTIFAHTDSLVFWGALGILMFLGIYWLVVIYYFQTFLAIDWAGIHIMHAKKGELGCISWDKIELCKFYPGIYDNPSVCVLFQSLNFSVNNTYVYFIEGPIDVKLEGKKILCDRALLRLCRTQITLAEFMQMDGWGIAVTAQQFARIKIWADHFNEDACPS